MVYKYAERSFPRDRFQWAKCVFKYMHDGLTPDNTQLFVLLAEVSKFFLFLPYLSDIILLLMTFM